MLKKVLLLTVAATFLSLPLFVFAGVAREGKATSIVIQQFPSWNRVPIVITAAKVNGQVVEAGVPINASDEWIRYLSVIVKNVSAVELAGVSISVEFARDADGEPLLPDLELSAGTNYMFAQDHSGKDLGLKPGDCVELSVSEDWYRALEYELKHREGLPGGILRRATVTPLMASFSQDRVWVRGNYMIRDIENRNRWLPDSTEQKMSRTLPATKVVNVLFRHLPGCYITGDIEFKWCTGTGCTTCSVTPSLLKDVQTGGWKKKNVILQCKKLVNGELVPCTGCTMNATDVDYFQPCS